MKNAKPNQDCTGCKHLKRPEKGPGQDGGPEHICTRFPPTIHEMVGEHPISHQPIVGFRTMFPMIKLGMSVRCGEYNSGLVSA
jgi:hypothetical protein